MNICILRGSAVIAFLFFAACNNTQPSSVEKPDALQSHLDTTINPGDDFFEYANGGWIKNNPIPADETNWGIGELVQKELYDRLLKINDEALAKNSKAGPDQRIGDFWFSAMDSADIEKNGITPLQPELNAIARMATKEDVMAQIARMHEYGAEVFYREGVSQDPKRSDVQAYHMSQGGLGMPNRDYYFKTDDRTTKIRSLYPVFIATIFKQIGVTEAEAEKKANAIMKLETELAKASRNLEELRDPYANYHKYAIVQLKSLAPGIDWPKHLAQMGVKHVDSVIVGQPEFYEALAKVISSTDMQTMKDYMTFMLINTYAEYLSKPFSDANFAFYSKAIRGAQEQHPRWRRALDAEEAAIGEELGKLFVKEYFDTKAKTRYEQMVENVRNAYKTRIEKLDWMTDSTKQKAIAKLIAITKKVGYPDKWKDFSDLKIDRGPLVLNMMRSTQWWNAYEINKLGKPVDRTEWNMTPQTYNAYYNESNNEIVLPAAMMTVPGYRDEELDDALVYGYVAASTVGHEITHGFDDQGRKFDAMGNLRGWWSVEDTVQFMKRANVLVQQFNAIVPQDTMHINGNATLGENLADLGGILIGLDAFKQTEAYKSGKKIAGLTQLQRYFLGYSLGWMMAERPERIATQLLTDVHSPAKYRINGPFPNVPEFYEAFTIKPGDKMYIADSLRVHLW